MASAEGQARAYKPMDADYISPGGAAGLGSLKEVHDAGFSVMGLEAQDHLTGRVKDVEPFGPGQGQVAEGGEWVHRGWRNPFYRLLKQAGTLFHRTDFGQPAQLGDRPMTPKQEAASWKTQATLDKLFDEARKA